MNHSLHWHNTTTARCKKNTIPFIPITLASLLPAMGRSLTIMSLVNHFYTNTDDIIFAWRSLLKTTYVIDSCAEILKLAQIALIMPVTTVECERGFSKLKLVKDSTQNCLSTNLDSVLRLYIGEDDLNRNNSFYQDVIKSWNFQKRRRAARGNYNIAHNKRPRINDNDVEKTNSVGAQYNNCHINNVGSIRM